MFDYFDLLEHVLEFFNERGTSGFHKDPLNKLISVCRFLGSLEFLIELRSDAVLCDFGFQVTSAELLEDLGHDRHLNSVINVRHTDL